MAGIFSNLYYRYVKFPSEFKNSKGISAIGNIYHNSLISKAIKRGERTRKQILRVNERIISNDQEIKKLESSPMVENDQFHSMRRNMRWQMFLFYCLLIAEIGLNIFTARIIIPAFELRGLVWDLVRLAIAIAVTITATWACDKFLEALFEGKKEMKAQANKAMRLVIYVLIFAFAEVVIAYFGLVRAKDLEGGGQDVTTAMTILAMIVPVVAGAIWWNIHDKYDEYQNRKEYEKRLGARVYLNSRLKDLKESEVTDFKRLANNYWYTYLSIKTYKENYNQRKKMDEQVTEKHLNNFDDFNDGAFHRYNQTLAF